MKTNFLLLFLAISASLFSQIPTTGLLRHYPFNSNATDAVTNATSVVTGATLTTDRFGVPNSAYYFNGVNNYITIPTPGIVGLNVYSYSYWVKPYVMPSNFSMVISIGNAGGSGQGQASSFGPLLDAVNAGYNVGSNPLQSFIATPNGGLTLNQWHHVVATRDMTGLQLFVNGVQIIGTNTVTALTNNQLALYGSTTAARFGVRSNLSNTYFGGVLDDVRIYNTVLTPTQVIALYNEPCSRTLPDATGSVCPASIINLNIPIGLPGTLNWYSSATSTVPILSGTNASIFIPAAGSYTYFTEYSNCPNLRSTITITTYPQPTISVNSGTICAGSTFTMMPTGASSYTFSSFTNTVAPSTNTFFTVTGQNNFGCLSANTATAFVTIDNGPLISVNSGSICSGTVFTMTASGASSYTFSSGSNTVAPITNTFYTVIGKSNAGCLSANTATSFVYLHVDPTISISSGFVCLGNSFTLSPTGAVNYTVIPGNQFIVTPTINTNYTISGVSSINGCPTSTVAQIAVAPSPSPQIVAITSICRGEETTLHAIGDDIFTWDFGSQEKYVRIKPQITTTYTLNAVNSFGCANKSTITVNVLNCTSLNDMENTTENVFVFPNPIVDQLNIDIPLNVNASYFQLTDYSGRIVFTENLSHGQNSILLKKANICSGIYQLTVVSETGIISTKRIVVQ